MTTKDKTINRRDLLVGAGAMAVLAAMPAAARADSAKVTIGINRDPQLGAQLLIARVKNYFQDEGLDPTFAYTDTGGDLIPLMAGKSVNLAGTSVMNLISLDTRGGTFKVVSSLCDFSNTQGIVLRPGLKLNDPKELEGLKLAATPTNPTALVILELGRRYGFDGTKVTLENMQPAEGVVAASRGDVDGVLTYPPYLGKMVAMGGTLYCTGSATYFDGKETVLPPDQKLLNVRSVLAGDQQWMRDNPDTVQAVIRAVIKANDFITADPKGAADIIGTELKADPAIMLQSVQANKYSIALDADVQGAFAFAQTWLKKTGQLSQDINIGDYVDTEFLKSSHPDLVSL